MVIQLQLSLIELYAFSSTEQIEVTVLQKLSMVPWDYNFIPMSHQTVNYMYGTMFWDSSMISKSIHEYWLTQLPNSQKLSDFYFQVSMILSH